MAQAVSTSTLSTFITQLLAPIAASADPRQKRAQAAELRRDQESAWSIICHRFYAAEAYRNHCSHLRRAAEIDQRRLVVSEAVAAEQAQLDLISAIDALMHVPSPSLRALRMKQKLRNASGGRDRWEAAIAADEARLT